MRMQIGRKTVRHLLVPALIGFLVLPSLGASNKWQRVQKIKPNTFVYVGLAEEKYLEGRFLGSDAEGMTIRIGSQGEMILSRDRVLWIAIDHSGRRWFSIPLAIIAGTGGGAAAYSIANHASCSDSHDVCGRAKGYIVGVTAGFAGGLAYYLSRGPSTSKKVVYEKPSAAISSRGTNKKK